MGFFKKLKDKILGSKPNKEIIEASKTKEEKQEFVKKQDSVFNDFSNKNQYVAGLDKSSKNITKKINDVFKAKPKVDGALFAKIEEILIMSDLGLNLTHKIIVELKKEIHEQNIDDFDLLKELIVDKIFVIYSNMSFIQTDIEVNPSQLKVILMSGINGAGKTTTIAKLANMFKKDNKKVILAAADTFRAAAVEQLDNWAQKVGVRCIKGQKEGQDPASVVFDALRTGNWWTIWYFNCRYCRKITK